MEKKPIKPKVMAGGTGASLSSMVMVIVAWGVEEGLGVNLPAAVVTASVGLISAISGFILAYYTREE